MNSETVEYLTMANLFTTRLMEMYTAGEQLPKHKVELTVLARELFDELNLKGALDVVNLSIGQNPNDYEDMGYDVERACLSDYEPPRLF